MKTIGIKLADGSFYPILEEGAPGKKALGLVTAKDNQTRVIVDLYRSKDGSMDDAEYVDSLQIDNLVAREKGSSEINLKVGLDDEGKLTAELVDPETGAVSNADVTLVSRTLEERLAPSEFDLTETEEKSNGNAAAAGAIVAGAAAGGLMAAAMRHNNEEKTEKESATETAAEEETAETPAEDSFSADDLSFDEEPATDSTEKTPEEDTFSADDLSFDDEPAAETTEDFPSDSTTEASDATQGETSVDDFDLPDFDMGEPDAAPAEDSTENTTEEKAEETIASDDDFELPDFDTNADTTEAASEESNDDFDFDFDADSKSSETEPAPDSTLEMMKHSSALKFDNLYDKETMEGNSSIEEEEEEVSKKTRVPVIICIVCAIICLICAILVLFIVPSKYNLLHKKSAEKPVEVVQPVEIEEPEPEPEPEIIEAKEEEIVVVDEPEKIAPEPPKEPEVKPEDITYKIKWGDTLWDIADAYYKNPWNYKKIARYNGIKNPDYIISGTYIKIPAK